jgi:hypothetical protein
MRVAFELARGVLPRYGSKFSRHDFTLAQLFACLVVKEHQRKSYREAELLLRDARHWCRDIGMRKVPDHNTLCRAFHTLNLNRRRRQPDAHAPAADTRRADHDVASMIEGLPSIA